MLKEDPSDVEDVPQDLQFQHFFPPALLLSHLLDQYPIEPSLPSAFPPPCSACRQDAPPPLLPIDTSPDEPQDLSFKPALSSQPHLRPLDAGQGSTSGLPSGPHEQLDHPSGQTAHVLDSPTQCDVDSDSTGFASMTALSLTDSTLQALTLRDLNQKIRMSSLSVEAVRALKHRRRTLKNRGYAAVCRGRRLLQKEALEQRKQTLVSGSAWLRREIHWLALELDELEASYKMLLDRALENNVSVPDDLMQPIRPV